MKSKISFAETIWLFSPRVTLTAVIIALANGTGIGKKV